jgi:hypothetical protein
VERSDDRALAFSVAEVRQFGGKSEESGPIVRNAAAACCSPNGPVSMSLAGLITLACDDCGTECATSIEIAHHAVA